MGQSIEHNPWDIKNAIQCIKNAILCFLEGECSSENDCIKVFCRKHSIVPSKAIANDMMHGLVLIKSCLYTLLEKEKAPEILSESQMKQLQEVIRHDKQKLQEGMKAYLKYTGCDTSKTPHRKYFFYDARVCQYADEYDEA